MAAIIGPFYHGTKAVFAPGDMIGPGHASNYGAGRLAHWVHVSARLDIAVLAAELAGNGDCARVYLVEPCGALEDDPNVTDKKFPGNPTLSYRTRQPLRVVVELRDWAPTPAERLKAMREAVSRMRDEGIEALE